MYQQSGWESLRLYLHSLIVSSLRCKDILKVLKVIRIFPKIQLLCPILEASSLFLRSFPSLSLANNCVSIVCSDIVISIAEILSFQLQRYCHFNWRDIVISIAEILSFQLKRYCHFKWRDIAISSEEILSFQLKRYCRFKHRQFSIRQSKSQVSFVRMEKPKGASLTFWTYRRKKTVVPTREQEDFFIQSPTAPHSVRAGGLSPQRPRTEDGLGEAGLGGAGHGRLGGAGDEEGVWRPGGVQAQEDWAQERL